MDAASEAPWLTAKIDQRVALMVERGALDFAREGGTSFIMSLLDEGEEHMTGEERERWERTCDNCGRYVPPVPHDEVVGKYTDFYTGYTQRIIEGIQIMLAFGVCGTCKEATSMEEDER